MEKNKIQTCKRCILDVTVKGIHFDENGVCNYCYIHDLMAKQYPLGQETKNRFKKTIQEIKTAGHGKKYNCIVGVSGGVDSTYCLYLAKKLGLKPLAVHLDNGWNSEIANNNIEQVCRRLKVDLETIVIDWEEFKDLELAFLKASVPDLEVTSDLAIRAAMFKIADQENIKYIINGQNFRTEGKVPLYWSYGDDKYVASVYRQFTGKTFRSYPLFSFWKQFYFNFIKKIRFVQILEFIDFNKTEAQKVLKKEVGWQDYGGKHRESIITRFLQTYILPRKFHIDKRKIHLAALVRSGQLTRSKALVELQKPIIPEVQAKLDRDYVVKKLGLTQSEFNQLMALPPKTFEDYPNRFGFYKRFNLFLGWVLKLFNLPTPILFHTIRMEEKFTHQDAKTMGRWPWKNIISGLIVAGLLAMAVWYIKTHLADFSIISQVDGIKLVVILGLVLVNYFSIGLTFKLVLQPFGLKLGFKEWFGLTMITSMGNLFIPSGGLGFRAVYLKQKYHFDYTHFLSTFAALSIIDIILFGLTGLVGLYFISLKNLVFNWPLAIFFVAILLLCSGALIFSPALPAVKNQFLQKIINVFKSWYNLKAQPGLLAKLFLTTGLNLISSIFIYFFAFRALGLNITWLQSFLPAALGDYGGYMRILPAAAGFFEGAVIYASQVLHSTPAQGLLVAEIIRITGIFWAVSLGLIFGLILTRRSKP